MNTNIKLIDIDEVFRKKNAKLYKVIPKFFLSFLKKIVHQDRINNFIWENKDKSSIDFIKATLSDIEINTEINGLENVPKSSKIIFAANHPVGSIDGLALIEQVYSIFGQTKAVVNDILNNIDNLKDFFIGVNKHGITSKEYVSEMNKTFESEIPIIFFPAGLASRRKKGIIKDLEWKKTFISRSVKFKRDVIPVYIEGNLSDFFYNLANLRTKLGIKSNIEMLFLVNEMYKQQGKTIKIHFGKAISHTTFDKGKTREEWAQAVKEHVYKLKTDRNAEF